MVQMLTIGVVNYDPEVLNDIKKRIEDYNSLLRKYETFLAKALKA